MANEANIADHRRTTSEGGPLPGGAPDLEVHSLMNRLSDLQAWCALMARKDSGGIAASQLIQDTRCLIVERLYPRAIAAKEAEIARLSPERVAGEG